MENKKVKRVRVSEADARARGTYRSVVECHSLQKSRIPGEAMAALVQEIVRSLREHPGNVWCFSGTREEVYSLSAVFRSARWKTKFSVQTRAGTTELYVRLREEGVSNEKA